MGIKVKLADDAYYTIADSFASRMVAGAPWTEYSYFEEMVRLFWTEFGAVLCLRDYRGIDSTVWLEFERPTDATYFKLKWL